jgi:hypothetical protein
MERPKYFLLTQFGFYKHGQAWIKLSHIPPVIAGGLAYWQISLVIQLGKQYFTHSYQTAFSPYDQWPKEVSGVMDNLQVCTGAYGQLSRSTKSAYQQACVACCEANQWTNGDISYVWGKPDQ